MTGGLGSTPPVGDARHPPDLHESFRFVLLCSGVVLLVACLVPPLSGWARHYEFAEALVFALLAVTVPALLVAGAPWRRLGLAARVVPSDEDMMTTTVGNLRPVDRLALGRRRHLEFIRTVGFAVLYVGAAVLWRIPLTVDSLRRHPWLAPIEALVLVAAGVGLWCEVIESPPLAPRLSRPHRIALAAISMWTIWVLAYLVGLSHGSWYPAYPHHAGQGLSVSADQQLTTGLLWFISGCAFIPVVFWNLIRWLQAEENPDGELRRLAREDRIRGRSLDHRSVTH